MKCRACESEKVTITTISENQITRRETEKWVIGISFVVGLWFIGNIFPTLTFFGWILLLYLIFTNKRYVTVNKKVAICQDCGTSWTLKILGNNGQ